MLASDSLDISVLFCLVQKSYIMTLNIIYSFPYLNYVAQFYLFGFLWDTSVIGFTQAP